MTYKCRHTSVYTVIDNIAECCVCYEINAYLLSCNNIVIKFPINFRNILEMVKMVEHLNNWMLNSTHNTIQFPADFSSHSLIFIIATSGIQYYKFHCLEHNA